MNELLRAATFGAVSAVLTPFSVAGYVLWVSSIVAHARKGGASLTAQGPLSARYLQHVLGARRDPAAARLLPALPGVPSLAVHLVATPALLARRISGYVPKLLQYPYPGRPEELPLSYEPAVRASYFDAVLARELPSVKQLVILGAGFDTRCYALAPEQRLRAFEVDMPQTQALKRELLQRTGVDASRVTFVSADFERDDWRQRLEAAGFASSEPAVIVWEGVTMYLERAAIERSLRSVASLARGTTIAFDFFTSDVLKRDTLYLRYARATTRLVGEPLRFGIDATPPLRERARELLRSCGLQLEQLHAFGEHDGARAWGGFAVARVA
jgi:methyltransferase (TIGR00027 family)